MGIGNETMYHIAQQQNIQLPNTTTVLHNCAQSRGAGKHKHSLGANIRLQV